MAINENEIRERVRNNMKSIGRPDVKNFDFDVIDGTDETYLTPGLGGTTANLPAAVGSEWDLINGERGWRTIFSSGNESSTPHYRLMQNSIVAGLMARSNRNLNAAKLHLYKRKRGGGKERIVSHPVIDLLYRPNDDYDLNYLRRLINQDLRLDGNSFVYVEKSYNGNGIPVKGGMRWLPRKNVRIIADKNSPWLDSYEYTANGVTKIYRKNEILHFRAELIDENDPRLGIAPLRYLLDEVILDIAAGKYPGLLLHNNAVPGSILIPDDDSITESEAELMRESFDNKARGKNRGRTMVITAKMKLERMGFSPEELDLTALRLIPEQRILEALGIPCQVTELGAGQLKAAFNNVTAADQRFYEQHLGPFWDEFDETGNSQYLPMFGLDNTSYYLEHDTSEIAALQEDKAIVEERAINLYLSGLITQNEGRLRVGQEVTDGGDKFHEAPSNPKEKEKEKQQLPSKSLLKQLEGYVDGEIIDN